MRIVLNTAVRVIFGADMNEVSFLHFLMYCQASGGVMRLCEIEDGAQEQRILGGAQSIAQILADQLNAPIHLNRPVTRIEQSDCGVSVMAGQHTYVPTVFFVNGATPLVSKIQFMPPLPLARRALNERMPMGGTIKCMVAYDTPFWKDRGYSGEVVADGDPLTVVFDNTTEEGIPILLGFIVGQPARLWGTRPLEQRRAAVMNALVRYFGPDAHQSIGYREKDWAQEPFTCGCPIAVPTPGMWSIHRS